MKQFQINTSKKIKAVLDEHIPKIQQEIFETKELYHLLLKWSKDGHLKKDDMQKVKAQLFDILKTIPALAILIIPFGSIILYLLIKTLPFNILPSAFLDDEYDKIDK